MFKFRINPRLLAQTALLVALEIVLNRFCSINTMGWKIGFSFVPIVVCAALNGPWWAAIAYALSDFLGAVLFPIGPYHPGFTLCAAVMGFVYGVLLYGRWEEKGWKLVLRAAAAAVINNILIGLFVNTYWVSQLYGSKSYWGWFVYRLAEYAVLVPMQILLVPGLMKLAYSLHRRLAK